MHVIVTTSVKFKDMLNGYLWLLMCNKRFNSDLLSYFDRQSSQNKDLSIDKRVELAS